MKQEYRLVSFSRELWSSRVRRRKRHFIRWIEALVRSYSWYIRGGRHFFGKYYEELVKSHKWCFIVGCNNSGTTLLQKILDLSGQCSTLPYEGHLYTSVIPRAKRRGHERVWTEYLSELSVTTKDPLQYAPRLLHDWLRHMSLPIREIVVEKTPANVARMTWLQQAFPSSRFICITRNGYAVAEGINRKAGKSIERAARHWKIVNKIMLEQLPHIEQFLQIRYEDITEKPIETAKALAHFLDIDSVHLIAAMRNKFALDTIKGNHQQTIKNMNYESIARLTVDNIAKIEAVAADMLKYFGYTAY